MSTTIRINGMDPSLSNFGIAEAILDLDTLAFTVVGLRVIQTEPEQDKAKRKVVRKNSDDLSRARLLHKGATDAAKECQLAFIEVPHGSQSAASMKGYGVCIGIIAAIDAVVPIVQVTPTEVKVAATGIKTATKEEMIEAMMAEFPDAPWPMQKKKGVMVPIVGEAEHLADAIGAIKAGLKTDEFRQTLAMMRRFAAAAA